MGGQRRLQDHFPHQRLEADEQDMHGLVAATGRAVVQVGCAQPEDIAGDGLAAVEQPDGEARAVDLEEAVDAEDLVDVRRVDAQEAAQRRIRRLAADGRLPPPGNRFQAFDLGVLEAPGQALGILGNGDIGLVIAGAQEQFLGVDHLGLEQHQGVHGVAAHHDGAVVFQLGGQGVERVIVD